jgi:hypothetical protein
VTRAEREAWKMFHRWIDEAIPALDGCAPIALICLPIDRIDADGAVQINIEGEGRIIWPKDVPVADRGPLLARLAEPYRQGTMQR